MLISKEFYYLKFVDDIVKILMDNFLRTISKHCLNAFLFYQAFSWLWNFTKYLVKHIVVHYLRLFYPLCQLLNVFFQHSTAFVINLTHFFCHCIDKAIHFLSDLFIRLILRNRLWIIIVLRKILEKPSSDKLVSTVESDYMWVGGDKFFIEKLYEIFRGLSKQRADM